MIFLIYVYNYVCGLQENDDKKDAQKLSEEVSSLRAKLRAVDRAVNDAKLAISADLRKAGV